MIQNHYNSYRSILYDGMCLECIKNDRIYHWKEYGRCTKCTQMTQYVENLKLCRSCTKQAEEKQNKLMCRRCLNFFGEYEECNCCNKKFHQEKIKFYRDFHGITHKFCFECSTRKYAKAPCGSYVYDLFKIYYSLNKNYMFQWFCICHESEKEKYILKNLSYIPFND